MSKIKNDGLDQYCKV